MIENARIESTIKLFAEQYYEKIFYFSLKKTGNQTEAEDLTSDIVLDIITALKKGLIPEYFSAYVWKSARSRFCKWAEKKYSRRKYFDDSIGFDILDNLDGNSDLESDYILKEDINVLRREISLISKDYREILVSFYIDDKKVSQIAKEFNLPEGTVKTKLFKSRKILTEGMKMAREFGVKSYKPEDVYFIKSGSDGSDGSPWSKIRTKLAKNILLEAYYNASTIEELSLELGVAAPYMEEAVDELVNAELLKKLGGNKYETDFMILSAENQRDIENAHLKIKDEYFNLAKEILDIIKKEGKKDLLGGIQTFEELKWLYLLQLPNDVNRAVSDIKLTDKTRWSNRPYNGQWELMGLEEYTKCEYNGVVGWNGGSNYTNDENEIWIWLYDFTNFNWDRHDANWVFQYENVRVASQILDGTVDKEKDIGIINRLIELGVFEIKDGNYICKMAIAKKDKELLSQSVNEDIYKNKIKPLYDKLVNLHSQMYDEVVGIVKKVIPERLQNKIAFVVDVITSMRSYLLVTAIKAGYIIIPEDFSKSMVGIAVYRK
ncbi:MAG: sigma-70 family RNA polymerase sigma factor [Oscillospiraceae bacterium]|nr:sigma-70 family RNA polymerase sigma factor [Oscillospiraceae bacterium]